MTADAEGRAPEPAATPGHGARRLSLGRVQEGAQSELDLGVLSTGSADVDRALAPLEGLAEREVSAHPEVFEQVLDELAQTMTGGTEAGTEPAARVRLTPAAAPMVRRRLDTELVRRGLARSRQQAADLVAGGQVHVGGVVAHKVATQVDAAACARRSRDAEVGEPYASRGATKLLGALQSFDSLVVAGRRCLDAGASTGGFTDVLLRSGAASVVAVDVGYGQLVWRLQQDPRVLVRDRTNVRDLTPEMTDGPVDLVVADLSFISLRLVLPAFARVTTDEADLVVMVKPQFEVGRAALPAGGVVRDPALRRDAVLGVGGGREPSASGCCGVAASPLPGPAGNVEYFLWLRRGGTPVGPRSGGPSDRGGPGVTDDARQILLVTHTGRSAATDTARRLVTRLQREGIAVVAPAQEAVELEVPGSRRVGRGGRRRARRRRGRGRHHLAGCGAGQGRAHPAARGQRRTRRLPGRGRAARHRPGGRADRRPRLLGGGAGGRRGRRGDRRRGSAPPLGAQRDRRREGGPGQDDRGGCRGRRPPLSRWGCDGVVCATPTGSTAYAFSAGGPVVWPDVDALLLVPLSAHALFARPLVIAPTSVIRIDLLPMSAPAVLSADGRRGWTCLPGSRVSVRRSDQPVPLARLERTPFTERLVAKFALPVQGWTVDRAGCSGSGTRTGRRRPGGSPVITTLSLSGLGVIDSAELELQPGLTVLTGETGAGKTMVVTSLQLLLGQRASADLVRAGADRAQVTAHLAVDPRGTVAERVRMLGECWTRTTSPWSGRSPRGVGRGRRSGVPPSPSGSSARSGPSSSPSTVSTTRDT